MEEIAEETSGTSSEKNTVTQTKSVAKPALKKVKSDQSSLFQHFKRSTEPKMAPPTPKVLFFHFDLLVLYLHSLF